MQYWAEVTNFSVQATTFLSSKNHILWVLRLLDIHNTLGEGQISTCEFQAIVKKKFFLFQISNFTKEKLWIRYIWIIQSACPETVWLWYQDIGQTLFLLPICRPETPIYRQFRCIPFLLPNLNLLRLQLFPFCLLAKIQVWWSTKFDTNKYT